MPKSRQTCTECSMRRQKCDRNLPCSRCIKRGEPDKCTREWPKDGYDPKKHRIYPRPEREKDGASPNDSSPGSGPGTAPTRVDITSPSADSRHGDRSHGANAAVRSNTVDIPANGTIADNVNRAPFQSSTPRSSSGIDTGKEPGVLESLTWGRSNLSDFNVNSFDLVRDPFNTGARQQDPEGDFSNGFGNANSAQISFLQLLLPSRNQIFQLVDYHLNYILWYHNAFHGETFLNELKHLSSGHMGLQMRDMDLRWTALLFAVMASSMTTAPSHKLQEYGFSKAESARLMRQWFKASLSCLNLADYMWRHHIYSLQAINTLTMSAHVLGFSNTQSTLLGAALKIAQGLGLQRIGPETEEAFEKDGSALTAAQKAKIVTRETKRRIWAQICNQDWFSIPFSEMYAIQKMHFTTSQPLHLDEATMLPLPNHVPSQVSFSRAINELASIMPAMHDAVLTATTTNTKYEQVLKYDQKLKAFATNGLPSYLSYRETISPDWPSFIPWARRGIRIAIAHKTIMIHRSFLGKSFTDTTFDYTRKACMEAAKVILKETSQARDDDGPSLWIEQAFMVAAGITLALDLFHRKTSDGQFEEHRKLVETAVNALSKFEYSMIARRGERLLGSLLAEQARLSAVQSMESYNARKRAHDTDEPKNGNDQTPPATHFSAFKNTSKRQRFDVPKFVENFVGQDNTLATAQKTGVRGSGLNSVAANVSTSSDKSQPNTPAIPQYNSAVSNDMIGTSDLHQAANQLLDLPSTDLQNLEASSQQLQWPMADLGYETFEQIFPPHAGISNSFLFEDLLNFEL